MDEKNQDKLVQHTPILNNEVKSIEVRDLTATWGQVCAEVKKIIWHYILQVETSLIETVVYE